MAVLLVAPALLLCHGAFGYAHQLERTESLTGPSVSQSAHAHEAHGHIPTGHGYSDGTHPPGAYFATLLALLFGAVLLPAFGELPRPELAVPKPAGRRPPSPVPHPPRGPTRPALQVFRL